MISHIQKKKFKVFFRVLALSILIPFVSTLTIPVSQAQSQILGGLGGLNLPQPGVMVTTSPAFIPPVLKGLIINPQQPFQFDFVFDGGDVEMQDVSEAVPEQSERYASLREEANKLIKYFLTSLTMPEDELWVNLSPYEKDRIIPDEFGKTEMGRDLLAQDYLLKQLTASLMYPEEELGKKFWDRIWEKVGAIHESPTQEMQSLAINTFNKVWIVPDKALIYENGDRAFIVETHMKVMLEEDYRAMASYQEATAQSRAPARGVAMDFQQNSTATPYAPAEGQDIDFHQKPNVGTGLAPVRNDANDMRAAARAAPTNTDLSISSDIIREIIIPEIEHEINNGKNFAKLRQIYHSFILAAWYKKNLHQSILSQKYVDQKKVAGLETNDKDIKNKIYQQYLIAFEKGVYNFIKEDRDETTQELIPRKYFSGGVVVSSSPIETQNVRMPEFGKNRYLISVNLHDPTNPTNSEASSPVASEKSRRPKRFQVSEDTFEYLGISEGEIIKMFESLGEFSLNYAGKQHLKSLIQKPLSKREAIVYSHNAIAELLELDAAESDHLSELYGKIGALEQLIYNMSYPAISRKKERDLNSRQWFKTWQIENKYPFRKEQQGMMDKMDLYKEADDFSGRHPNLEALTQAQVDEFIYFDLQEMQGVIKELAGLLERHRSIRFQRVLDKLRRVLNEKNLFVKPKKGQTLTARQRNLHHNLANYLGEISFLISVAVHAKKNGWNKPNMLEEAGTIDLKQVYHPPTAPTTKEPVLNDILITPEKSFYALTGPNAAGKSTTVRAIGYSVVFAHLGLFVPAAEANISWMENIYSLYPKEEAVKSGFSHFTRIMSLITQWYQNASERDLFLLDEPISGSDYPDLVGIAVTIYEDLIRKNATVVTATHIKDSIRILANHPDENVRNRVQPWINSFSIKEGKLDPHYELVPGIAKESHALASIKKIGMDDSIIKMAQMYYDLIAKGAPIDQDKLKEIIGNISHYSSGGESDDDIPWKVLDELFPAENFAFVAFGDEYDDFVMKLHGQSRKKNGQYNIDDLDHYEYQEGEFDSFPFAGGLGDEGRYELRSDLVHGSDPNEMLEIVGKLTQVNRDDLGRMHEKLKELVGIYADFRRAQIKGQVSGFEEITQDQYRDMARRMSGIVKDIREFLRGPGIKDVILQDESFDGWFNALPDLSQDLSTDVLEEQFKSSIEQAGYILQSVDVFLGMAIGAVDNKLSKPKVVDEEGKLKIDSGWYPLAETEENIPQDFELTSAANVFIGPNSSGKTNAFRMITSVMKLAALGFWVPAKNVEVSRGFDVRTYFGARDYDVERFSYFENVLWKLYQMIRNANKGSFMVFDEISGTDHLEMTAIQMSLLTYLKAIGATVILNTHLHEGLKELQDIIGLNVYRMDYDFIEETREFDFKRSISLDKEAKAESHGLEVATHYGFTEDQYQRAKRIAVQVEKGNIDGALQGSSPIQQNPGGGIDFNPTTAASSPVDEAVMVSLEYSHVTLDSQAGQLTLHDAIQPERKDGAADSDLLADGDNELKDIVLSVRKIEDIGEDEEEKFTPEMITQINEFVSALGIDAPFWVVERNNASFNNGIYGIGENEGMFLREDVLRRGTRGQREEALERVGNESKKSGRIIVQDRGLSELIWELTDEDKFQSGNYKDGAFIDFEQREVDLELAKRVFSNHNNSTLNRDDGLEILEEKGGVDAVPLVIEVLSNDDDYRYRRDSAEALGKIGLRVDGTTRQQVIIPALIHSRLNDDETSVRIEAFEALAKLDNRFEKALDLNLIMEELADSAGEREKNINVVVNLPEQPLLIESREEELLAGTLKGTVFFELIFNAVKYTPEGGQITVTLSQQGDQAVVVIEDTGIGVPDNEKELIWLSRLRGEAAQKMAKGTGQGLSSAADVVGQSGYQGTIELTRSEVGSGSVFTVRIPIGQVIDYDDLINDDGAKSSSPIDKKGGIDFNPTAGASSPLDAKAGSANGNKVSLEIMALDEEAIEKLKGSMPQYDWEKASNAVWGEFVRDELQVSGPLTDVDGFGIGDFGSEENRLNYQKNQVIVRREILKLLHALHVENLDYSAFKERFRKLHEYLLTGEDGETIYVPPSLIRSAQDSDIRNMAGVFMASYNSMDVDIDFILRKTYSRLKNFLQTADKNDENINVNLILRILDNMFFERNNVYIFNRGNFSLYMNLVNALFRLTGLNGIRHGEVDFQLMRAKDVPTYKDEKYIGAKAFIRLVEEANSNLKGNLELLMNEDGEYSDELLAAESEFRSQPLGRDNERRDETDDGVGGIDFNPNLLNIQSQGNRVEIPALNDPQRFQNIEINGLVPFIFNITPITNIPMILGESQSQEQSDEFSLSRLN